ncbi:Ketoreductase CTB6 [Paramyrothecium foliicola]|nr:Ketoreductase CTB6 [Paramyrothecium foliicola]
MADQITTEKLLITGISGYIGFQTLIVALQRGYQVRGVVRDQRNIQELRDKSDLISSKNDDGQLEFAIVPDFLKLHAMEEILDSITTIVHLASPLAYGVEGDDYDATVIQPAVSMITVVLEAAAKTPTVRRVVITSSCVTLVPFEWNFAPDTERLYTSTDINASPTKPYNSPMEAYWASKAFARMATRQFIEKKHPKFDFVHLLPSVVIGRDERLSSGSRLENLLDSTRKAVLAPALDTSLNSPFPFVGVPVHVADVARAHIDAVDGGLVPGNTEFILSSDAPEGVVWDKQVHALCRKHFPTKIEDGTLPLQGSLGHVKFRLDAMTSEQTFKWKFTSFENTMKGLIEQYIELKESAASLSPETTGVLPSEDVQPLPDGSSEIETQPFDELFFSSIEQMAHQTQNMQEAPDHTLFHSNDDSSLVATLQSLVIYAIIILSPDKGWRPRTSTDYRIFHRLRFTVQEVVGGGLFLQEERDCSRPTWEAWIAVTSKRRAILSLYLLHWAYSIFHCINSYDCQELAFMPAPAAKVLWQAATEHEWDLRYKKWLARWDGQPYLQGEFFSIVPGVLLNARADRWLAETDEFGLIMMGIDMPANQMTFVACEPGRTPNPATSTMVRSHCMKGRNARVGSRRSVRRAKRAALDALQAVAVDPSTDARDFPGNNELVVDLCHVRFASFRDLAPKALPLLIAVDPAMAELARDARKSPKELLQQLTTFIHISQSSHWVEPFVDFDSECLPDAPPLDGALLHSMLLINSIALDVGQNRPIAETTCFNLVQTLRIVNRNIARRDGCVQDSVLFSVLYLALAAACIGDRVALQSHMAGLKKIVELRGGVEGSPKLQFKLERLDLLWALKFGGVPYFLAEHDQLSAARQPLPSSKEADPWFIKRLDPELRPRDQETFNSFMEHYLAEFRDRKYNTVGYAATVPVSDSCKLKANCPPTDVSDQTMAHRTGGQTQLVAKLRSSLFLFLEMSHSKSFPFDILGWTGHWFERVSGAQRMGLKNRENFHKTDWDRIKDQPEFLTSTVGLWLIHHDPAKYANENFEICAEAKLEGNTFKNTNAVPGYTWKLLTTQELLSATDNGKEILDAGDWSPNRLHLLPKTSMRWGMEEVSRTSFHRITLISIPIKSRGSAPKKKVKDVQQ